MSTVDGITVTAHDPSTGDVGKRLVVPGDYCLVTVDPLYLAHEARHANGTVVLTLKRRHTDATPSPLLSAAPAPGDVGGTGTPGPVPPTGGGA